MEGHDTLALLPTGGGKSLCYQLPAIAMEGICIVVSPLIALMKDQVERLGNMGIKAACLTSGMSIREQETVLNNSLFGKTKLLYIAPERLKNNVFLGHLRQMKVSMVAVDEAHCIAQWGHDFRPTYNDIAIVRDYHPTVPILALTATATPQVAKEIAERLSLRDLKTYKSSFCRDNLSYSVVEDSDKKGRLLRIFQAVKGCGIVYVRNRRRTQEVAQYLYNQGVPATCYHAGLSAKERDKRQADWMRGDIRVMVATNAFGMGIDKADVRTVVHLDIPDSVEAYFQEAGRAGRDSKIAYAVIIYETADLEKLKKNHETSFPPQRQINNIYQSVCSFYKIPIGSGEGRRFDYDMEAICHHLNISPLELHSSMRFVERGGLVALPDREDTQSRLFICTDKETLYRFQVAHRRYDGLLQSLQRLYGGLFTEFVTISEREIARKCYLDETTIEKMLLHLDALHIVSYVKRSDKRQIYFTCNRVGPSQFYLDEKSYLMQKKSAWHRIEAMSDYVKELDRCRSRKILDYFEEESTDDCGLCDICRKRARIEEPPLPGIDEEIRTLLKESPLTMKELVKKIKDKGLYVKEKDIVDTVRMLLDCRQLTMDEDFKLDVCG